MKYCSNCGKQLPDNAAFCSGCGQATAVKNSNVENNTTTDVQSLLNTLSQRLNTSAIIWFVIGILQVLSGFFIIIGVLNIISAVQDMNYSKELLKQPKGIVARFESTTGPIITLIYNLLFGGTIGVLGSIYYFLALRSFVLENRKAFESLDV